MKDLVVLYSGEIVYLSSISEDEIFDPANNDLLFFPSGRVRRFKKNGIAYMAIFDESNNSFNSYRAEIDFWNNNKVNKQRNGTNASYESLGRRFNILDIIPQNVRENENVILAHEIIDPDSVNNQEIKTDMLYRRIPYKVALPLSKHIDLYNVPSLSDYDFVDTQSKSILPSLTIFYNFIKNKKFLLPNGELKSITEDETSILTDVIQVFNWIYKQPGFINYITSLKLNEPFNQVINLSNRYNHDYGSIDSKYHSLYNDEYFARLRLGLIEFKYWLIQYSNDYTKINVNDLIVYIINLFDPVELSYLSYETKINLLNKILKDNFWVIGNWGFNKLNEEEAIIKIVRCIAREDSQGNLNYVEIDKFMDFLNKIYYSHYNYSPTLYEVLYDKINDSTFFNDDGTGNKGLFVKEVYKLWNESKFNPQHSVNSIAQNALNNFRYTPYNARWQFDDPTIQFPHQENDASPMIINYESEKILAWYVDNFDFRFYQSKILAKVKVKDQGYQAYGFYNIFQPIALKITNSDDTIIRMPAKGITEGANITDFIENCFPVFYLKYIDDLGDKSDTKETIATLADVILTFTGVGNIAKLRHVKDLSLVRKLFMAGELSTIERVALTRALSGLASGAEAIIGVASLVHRFATAGCTIYYNNEQNPPELNDPEYQKYKLCQSIDIWLFALEMLSLSGDLLARRAFRRATKKLQQSIPSGNEYSELRTAVNSLDEIDDMLIKWLNSIKDSHRNVYNKLITFTDEEKKFAFMFDFEKDILSLDRLNDIDGNILIDEWLEVEYLLTKRKQIDFLIGLKKIKNFDELNVEVFKGKTGKTLLEEFEHLPPPHPNSHYSWQAKGVHHKEALQSFGTGGKGRIDPSTKVDIGPPGLGYYEAKVELYIPEFNGGWKVKNGKKKSSFFPDHWSKERVQEELAFASKNKVFKGGNKYQGIMSDGVKVQFHIDNGIIKTAFPIF